MIEITTLGGSSVQRDGLELSGLSTHKQKFALLAYLAIEGPVARDRLLAVFWPEREEEKARHSLSQALYALKRELNQDCIRVTGDQVGLVADAVAVDAKRLEAAADDERWETVIDLYDGPFLDPFHVPGAREFEDWQSHTRARLARLARRGFARVAEAREAAGDHQGALAAASRWAGLEPLEDEAQHTLIALLARAGQRSEALEHYEAYRERLARELDVEPLEETVALVERIRAGEMPEFRPLAATERPKEVPQVRELPAAAYFKTSASARADEAAHAAPVSRRGRPTSLLEELRARRVFHVGAAYLAVSWLAIEVTGTFIEHEVLPRAVFPVLLFFLVVGLPFALILAWAQEQKATGVPATEAVPTAGPWPRWFEKVRGGHVLAFLSALLLALLIASLSLRGAFRSEPPIDATVGFDPAQVAVLYFDDHSEGQENRHLAAGFTDALIDQLGQVEGLQVRSLNAVKPYREANVGVDNIGRALQVGSLVEGSILMSGARLRVSVRLVDAATGTQLDNRTLQRPMGEILALLDDVTQEVMGFLRRQLGVEIRLREWRTGTESDAAWELVKRAEKVREDYRPLLVTGDTAAASTVLHQADTLLAQAESLDPAWIEPIVMRGWVAWYQGGLLSEIPGTYQKEWLLRGLDHAERALNLKSEDPHALELRGTLRYSMSRQAPERAESARLLAAAERDLRAAVVANPSQASAWSTLSKLLHLGKGEFAEAKQAALRAYEEDEFLEEARAIIFRLFNTSLELEEYEEAIYWAEEGRRRFPDVVNFPAAELFIFTFPTGPEPDVEKAWELVDEIQALSPPQRLDFFVRSAKMQVATVLARAEQADSAKAVIKQARAGASDEQLAWLSYDEAHAWLLLGERTEALRALRMHLQAEPQKKAYIAADPWFEDLRDEPRFKALVGTDR